MASLKELRNRIASVKATQKITKAMQMVAAAKLRRAQEAAEAARPYSERMAAVLSNVAQSTQGEEGTTVEESPPFQQQVVLADGSSDTTNSVSHNDNEEQASRSGGGGGGEAALSSS